MSLKKIIDEYLLSWFQENPHNYNQLQNLKKTLSPIKLNGHFEWGMALGEYRIGDTARHSPMGKLIHNLKYKEKPECG